jgi:hypothetical protein
VDGDFDKTEHGNDMRVLWTPQDADLAIDVLVVCESGPQWVGGGYPGWDGELYRALAVSEVSREGEDLAKRAFDSLQALAFGLPAGHPIARTGISKVRSAAELANCCRDAV